MIKKVSCFLPCRKGSERIPNKNVKPFGQYQNGLLEIKLNQLLSAEHINKIYLSTNDESIIEYAHSLCSERIIIHARDEALSSSITSTDDLIQHAAELVDDEHILWTHVTSPFITQHIYDQMIIKYNEGLQKSYDSLMSVTEIYGFLWSQKGPINYDRSTEKWPRTQTLEPVYDINSGAFISSKENYIKFQDRVGKTPYLYVLNKKDGHDIDWPIDFLLAEFYLKEEANHHE